ncbi:MAG: glycosyltransferase family 39 protein [Nanoarchaeota archaeon]|nr:glycosyltransferase family 39 protein [Nanoarchaeota archaeon]
MLKKEYIWLALIFSLVLGIRLYFAFQTPYFSEDAYFNIRQVENIRNTGWPLFKDDLSYSGRNFLFQPFFQYILAFFNLFMPLNLVCKLLPNIFASSLIFIVYLIAREITKSKGAALFSSFISGFIPIFFAETVNSVSVFSLVIPIMFFLIYSLIKINKHEKYIGYFIVSIIIIALMHPSAFLLIIALLLYLLFIRLEHLKQRRAELELIIFSTILVIWLNFVIYKNAFLVHGQFVIWQNIPKELLGQYFSQLNILNALFYIGIIPIVSGIYIIYKYIFKKKNRRIYLLMGFALSTLFLLWLRLIQLKVGLVFFGVILVLLFSKFYSDFILFIDKTRLSRYKTIFIALIFFVFIFNSIVPTISYTTRVIKETPSKNEIDAFLWLKNNSDEKDVVLASLDQGYLINAVAERKNVIDKNFLLIKDAEQRLENVRIIYTTHYETDAIPLLNKYNIKYIVLSKRSMSDYDITDLNYRTDEKCFELVYDKEVKIYKSLCKMEER